MDTNSPSERGRHSGSSHEASDVSIPAVVKFLAGLGLATALVYVLMWSLFRYFAATEAQLEQPPARMTPASAERLPPEPRLHGSPGHEIRPSEEIRRLQAEGEAALRSYGWVDRNAGVVRIPIERAMTMIVEKNLLPDAVTVGKLQERGTGRENQ